MGALIKIYRPFIILIITFPLILVCSALVSAQSISIVSKKLTCEENHLALEIQISTTREIELNTSLGILLRDDNGKCLQGVQHDLTLKPGENPTLKSDFDKVPCLSGKYHTEYKLIHDYVPRMVKMEKYDELFRQSSLDGVPEKYQNLFKNFDETSKNKLIKAVRIGDFEFQLKDELNSFMLQCP